MKNVTVTGSISDIHLDIDQKVTREESNILIFCFMGGKVRKGIIEKNATKYPSAVRGYSANGFILYHKSWECLMPVIESIEKQYKITTTITSTYVLIGYDPVKVHSGTKLEAAYAAVIKFLLTKEYEPITFK